MPLLSLSYCFVFSSILFFVFELYPDAGTVIIEGDDSSNDLIPPQVFFWNQVAGGSNNPGCNWRDVNLIDGGVVFPGPQEWCLDDVPQHDGSLFITKGWVVVFLGEVKTQYCVSVSIRDISKTEGVWVPHFNSSVSGDSDDNWVLDHWREFNRIYQSFESIFLAANLYCPTEFQIWILLSMDFWVIRLLSSENGLEKMFLPWSTKVTLIFQLSRFYNLKVLPQEANRQYLLFWERQRSYTIWEWELYIFLVFSYSWWSSLKFLESDFPSNNSLNFGFENEKLSFLSWFSLLNLDLECSDPAVMSYYVSIVLKGFWYFKSHFWFR